MNTIKETYWIGIKDVKDPLAFGSIPFEMAKSRTLLGAKREATRKINAYVPPSDLIESEAVAYIATGMNRRMKDWKRVAEKINKKWVIL